MTSSARRRWVASSGWDSGATLGVQALELVDHVQNAAKIVDEAAGLVVANGESGQVCGPAHMRFFKRHDRGFLAMVMEHISL
ncbi:hypothetical protein DK37_14510 [Halomonas sp. SUBG004]|nr:hypothetical protein DK37_14510 [Halomonas sp. SUBG004]